MSENMFLSVQWFNSPLIPISSSELCLYLDILWNVDRNQIYWFILNLSCRPYTNLRNLLNDLNVETVFNFCVFKFKNFHFSIRKGPYFLHQHS